MSQFGPGYVCDDGLCISHAALGIDSATDGDATQRDASANTTEAECTSHSECLDLHGDIDPSACVDGTCVPLRSEECPLLLPMEKDLWLEHLRTSDAIVLGAFSPIPRPSLISNMTRFNDLVLNDVASEVQGIPDRNGTRRELIMVVCEGETPNHDQLTAGAEHLITELQVPGIVSSLQSEDLQAVVEDYGRKAETFFISALDADDTIATLQEDGLIWTMLTNADQVAVSFKPLLTRTLDYLQRTTGQPQDGVARVALVSPTGEPRLLGDIGEAITDSIEFNGQDALDNFPDHFRAFDIDTIYGDVDSADDQSGLVRQLADFAPHVVIAMASDEFLNRVIPGLESAWTEHPGEQRPPFYILSPYHLNNPNMSSVLELGEDVRQRLLGVAYASAEDPDVYRDYLLRFDQAYPEVANDPRRLGLENFYDAPYYLTYAAAAATGNAPLSGRDLARGMSRLTRGPQYDIGRGDMVEAFNWLADDPENTITLRGTLGPARFDPDTGARADAGSVFCVDFQGNFVPDVMRWNPTDRTFVDAPTSVDEACIEDF